MTVLVGIIVGLYLAMMLVISLPGIRARIAEEVADALSRTIGSRVEIRNIKIGLFNTVTIDSLTIYDQQDKEMLRVGQLIGTVDLIPLLLDGKVSIANLRVFRSQASLYRESPGQPANYQFVIDSLAPKPGREAKTEVDLHSLLVRDLALKYDVLSQPHDNGLFDPNHIDVEKLNASLVFKSIKPEELDLRIRDMMVRIRGGMVLESLQATVTSDPQASQRTIDIKRMDARLGSNILLAVSPSRLVLTGGSPACKGKLCCDVTIGSDTYNTIISVDRKDDGSLRPILADISMVGNGRNVLQAKVCSSAEPLESSEADVHLDVTRSQVCGVLNAFNLTLPDSTILNRVAFFTQDAHIDINHSRIAFVGNTRTDLCEFDADVDARGSTAQYKLNVARLLIPASGEANPATTVTDAAMSGTVTLPGTEFRDMFTTPLGQYAQRLTGNLKARIGNIVCGNTSLSNIDVSANLQTDNNLSAELSVDDPNLKSRAVILLAQSGGLARLVATAEISELKGRALGIQSPLMPHLLSGTLAVDAENLRNLSDSPFSATDYSVTLSDVNITNADGNSQVIHQFALSSKTEETARRYTISGDIANGEMVSNIPVSQLVHQTFSQIANHLPTLNIQRSMVNAQSSNTCHYPAGFADLKFTINNLSLLADYLNSNIELDKPIQIIGHLSEAANTSSLTVLAPAFEIGGAKYEDTGLYFNSSPDSLSGSLMTTKFFGTIPVRIENHLSGRNDNIFSETLWKNELNGSTRGTLSTSTSLSHTPTNRLVATTRLLPTTLYVSDSTWQLSPAVIEYSSDALHIADLILSRGQQYISVSADYDVSGRKDLMLQLNDIEVAPLLQLSGFKPVEFGGKASGLVTSADSLQADMLVRDFTFNKGYLGSLRANASFNYGNRELTIKGRAQASDQDSTLIDGLVNFGTKNLDFRFKSEKTNLQFLNKYIGRFTSDLEGNTTGDFHLFGSFKYVQMECDEVINYLKFRPKMLGVLYTFENQPIHIRPDTIDFTGMIARDPYGNEASIRGSVNHKCLFNFNYDIDFRFSDLLTVNWAEEPSRAFWGSIFTDGNINLRGTTRDVAISGELSTSDGEGASVLFYNSNPSGGSNESRDYIHFVSPRVLDFEGPTAQKSAASSAQVQTPNPGADIRMNIKFNTTPSATLNIITDPSTRDYMSLRGSGPLQLSYYNKGKFELNGLYGITGGSYKLTIKDIIHKNFDIQPNGYLRFHGAPSEADINLKGVHRVNSVSLSDLNVGASQTNSTVGVDCILNFTGKAADPKVSFDIDFPRANNDENLLLKKFILTEEDRNMQAVYLLSIGRFYTYNYDDFSTNTGAQNQSTVAMTSFLAGTLSGQINNILQDAFHISNWNIGTNIAAGRMGLNDLEVQGSLSGRMFNNRLLFNGNIGYRDQITTYSNNFVGDFNLQWMLNRAGTISLKAYSETNDRYFTKSSLTTQGGGILFQKDFKKLRDFFR